MNTLRISHATALLLGSALSLPLQAQITKELALRSSFSLSAIQTRPQGALAHNIGFGYGGNAAYLFRLDKRGIVSLRADVGVVAYGNESKRAALSETVGDRVQVNVRTVNYIVPVSFGPELMWPTGTIRPYVNAGFARQHFFTESNVEPTGDYSWFMSTTNQSDNSDSWTAGGGIYIPVTAGKVKTQIDLGVQYLNGGTARYLAPGGIADLPGGRVTISPLESATHMLIVRLGARVGL